MVYPGLNRPGSIEPAEALAGERIRLRLQQPADDAALNRIRAEPEVLRWWGPPDEPDGESVIYVVEQDGRVIGSIQYYEQKDVGYASAGIDVYLERSVHGQGLGTDAVRTLAAHLVRDRGHHRLTIDPSVGNAPAIACYERVGFRPVGVMRSYERVWWEDGRYRDGLLMDLLAEDLTEL